MKKVYCMQCNEGFLASKHANSKKVLCPTCKENKKYVRKERQHICEKCGKPFVKKIKKGRKIHCNNCTEDRKPVVDLNDIVSILQCSKRTIQKILSRLNVSCSICGWNDSTCDIHHIVERKNDGSDDMENLILVCPNCHRVIHNTDKYSLDFLKEKNLSLQIPKWKDFYFRR